MNTAIERFAFVSQKFGMMINDRKTVVMRYNPTSTEQTAITIGNMQLQYVIAFNYLISKISPGNDMTAGLQRRIGQARSTFFQLKRWLWNQNGVRKCTKTRIFNALVTSTFLYGSGSWTRWEVDTTQLETTQYRLARLMLESRTTDHIRMTSAYKVLHMLPCWVRLAERTLTWAARMINLPVDRLPRLVMHSQLVDGKRNRGRPAARWSDTVKYVLKWARLPPYHDWATEVHTEGWKHMISAYWGNLIAIFKERRNSGPLE